ncbi:hypothetical protein GH5_05554 [Leishmania sp. Ghana 2012 LV757]|uniref:hypothetical protein n=1 Tax=Leishmania sp. Ghana 2012 LV757 TaxID=2803181 RepID=UPI001B77AB8E|nr:hypothetical protein GH5_05554 [Leishmania sp. Ghana 2012 LV757]
MEWLLTRVPFSSIVVEEEDGGYANVAEAGPVEVGRKGDVLTIEMDALQHRRAHLDASPASEAKPMRAVHTAAPVRHELAASPASNSGCSDSSGQATHGLRLALTQVATAGAAGSSINGTSSTSQGLAPFSRTLQLRSVAGLTKATAETPVLSACQPVGPPPISSRRRTLKNGAEAEEAVTRAPSPSRRAAAAKGVAAARQPCTDRGHTTASASKPVHARPVQSHKTSAPSTAATAPHPTVSEPPPSLLLSASPEERAAEAHRLAVQAARPASLSVCFDWWMYLCYYDTHALFTSQSTAFEVPLRPVAAASASVFYAELNRCFAAWRRRHWDSLVVLRSAGPVDADKRRRGAAVTHRAVRDPALLEYANAVWYEGLRVQRLMAQLLLSGSCGSWSFEVGCLDALLTALGAPPSAESPLCAASPGSSATLPPYCVTPGSPRGAAGTATISPTTLVRVTCKGAAAAQQSTDGLSIGVPTAARMLSLLHVLDVLWGTLPACAPFRMPVSEMEAPGYYRSIRDPVSLCQLYEEVFCGMTAPTHRACVRQHAHMTRRLLEVLKHPTGPSGSARALEEEVQARFLSHTHLRERLTTLKANCDEYNGGGSELSQQANVLLSAGVKALRDAQAEGGGWTSQVRGADAQEPLLAGGDGRTTQQPSAAGALFPGDWWCVWFPPSEAAAVVPPNLRHSLPIAQQTADNNSALVQRKGSRHRRVLRLPATAVHNVPVSAPPCTSTHTLKDFWVQCHDCNAWHKLATRLDPVPDTWTCGSLGLACPPDKKRRKADKRATTCAGRRRRAGGGESSSSARAASNSVTAAPHSAGGGVGDVSLADVFPVGAGALTVDAATPPKRGRSASRRPGITCQRPKKAHAEASARSSLSSSRSSSSSSSSDDDDSSRSGRSDSSNSGSNSDSSLSNGGGESTAPRAHRIRPGLRQARRPTVITHKLPRYTATTNATGNSSSAAATTSVIGTVTPRTTNTALLQLVQAVTMLEGQPLQESPFDQLEEIKRLEKRLSAID